MLNTLTYQRLTKFLLLTISLAFFVIGLGAYTRLKDAGLGCPDWPGCYGHWVAPVGADKAWIEMIHRYVAGFLGILVASIALTCLWQSFKHNIKAHRLIPILLLSMLIFQAALGKWTVTLQLFPLVVMGHLLGGFTLLALLWWLWLQLKTQPYDLSYVQQNLKPYRIWILVGLFLLIAQIKLGGWVSSNYAALICPTFPECQGSLWPKMNWLAGFNFLSPIGINYQGGVLDNLARVAIHMTHRLGALVVFIYIGTLTLWMWMRVRQLPLGKILLAVLFVLLLQITWGILNVKLLLPLPVAVLHNLTAALLLLLWITILFFSFNSTSLLTSTAR